MQQIFKIATLFCAGVLINATTSAADQFSGTQSCVSCHAEQHQLWQGSHHDLAMQHATTASVLGDFGNSEFSQAGITSRFFKKKDKYYVNTDGPDGKMQDFEISYAFGVTPLQQYLVEFPDGRIQVLSIAWDSRPESDGGQRWFHLYPDQATHFDDEMHWTRPQQNWNYMCAECHTTNLVKGYDNLTDRFNTTWSEIDVGCESCHGPGNDHIDWTKSDDGPASLDPDKGLKITLNDRSDVLWQMDVTSGIANRSKPLTDNSETGVCAACHSRRGILNEGIESDGDFLSHYRPALLTSGLYHADGQIQDEVYVWGSFLQSKMHNAGVTCSDCHDPHSLELRAPQEQVCAQCHLPSKFASTEHHHHQPNSAGANCLNCHMPETNYMEVDPRRDHSLRVPRPDLSLDFGTPNACNQCHSEKATDWAAASFNQYWPNISKPYQDWTTSFYQARAGTPTSEISLLNIIRDDSKPDIVRATAVSELAPYLSPISAQILQAALNDDSTLVRLAAVDVLESIPPANRYQLAEPLLQDPALAVRISAARVSVAALQTQLSEAQRRTLTAALSEYIEAQLLNADRTEANLNLGNLFVEMGDAINAEKAYRDAIKRDSKFAPAYVNLADLYRAQGLEPQAEKVLRQGIAQAPEGASLYHALGLMQARSQQLAAALDSLKMAAELRPDIVRYAYVYGVALNSTNKPGEAISVLEKAFDLHPNSREIMFMIASIYRDIGRFDSSRGWADKLLDLNPTDQNAMQLIQSIDALEGTARQ